MSWESNLERQAWLCATHETAVAYWSFARLQATESAIDMGRLVRGRGHYKRLLYAELENEKSEAGGSRGRGAGRVLSDGGAKRE
jgi:hypothetical protein